MSLSLGGRVENQRNTLATSAVEFRGDIILPGLTTDVATAITETDTSLTALTSNVTSNTAEIRIAEDDITALQGSVTANTTALTTAANDISTLQGIVQQDTTLENLSLGSSYSPSSGSDNVCIGKDCAPILTGSDNTLIGVDCGKTMVGGSKNTACGEQALESCAEGEDNVAIGRKAGNQHTGSACVFVGEQAGEGMDGDFNIMIGHEACAEMDGIPLQTGTKNIVVGNRAPPIGTTNFQCIATDLSTQVDFAAIASNSAVFGNKLVENTYFSGGHLRINVDPTTRDVAYITTDVSAKHAFRTNNNTVEALSIQDGKATFNTEIRFAGSYASTSVAGTPAANTLAFIGSELAYHNGTEWRKVQTSSF